jgi:hypothetical protein
MCPCHVLQRTERNIVTQHNGDEPESGTRIEQSKKPKGKLCRACNVVQVMLQKMVRLDRQTVPSYAREKLDAYLRVYNTFEYSSLFCMVHIGCKVYQELFGFPLVHDGMVIQIGIAPRCESTFLLIYDVAIPHDIPCR